MFKNCVFKISVNTKKWIKAALIRAIKTIAQTAVVLIGSDVVNIVTLDWGFILGACATAGVFSILTSVAGIPEVKSQTDPEGE